METLSDLLFGYFTFWTCLGVSVFALLSVLEVFNPYRSYYNFTNTYGTRLRWWEELFITLIGIFLWPITIITVFENITAINRGLLDRHEKHLEAKVEELIALRRKWGVPTVTADQLSAGCITVVKNKQN